MKLAWLVVIGCGGSSSPPPPPPNEPTAKLAAIATDALCITKGEVAAAGDRTTIAQPTVRGFARGTAGDAAALDFVYDGPTDHVVALASGDVRAQLGLKLRAADGCNLVYVMLRIEPTPQVVVQVKANPGKRTHEECGAKGYTRVKPAKSAKIFAPVPGSPHTLWAEIAGDNLVAWLDDRIVWQGTLPSEASGMTGPSGFRTDNVKASLVLKAIVDDPAATCPEKKAED